MSNKKRVVERRVVSGEVEVRAKGKDVTIEGHAAVFNKLSQNLGGFVERVRPGAFTKTLQEADVRALQNHDPNLVLGRNRSGTLELAEDTTGLHYRIRPPDTSYARDLMAVMDRGDVDKSSFGFLAVDEDWDLTDEGFPLRDLLQVRLFDVSVVTFPAYVDTDADTTRTMALSGLATRSGVAVTELADVDAIKNAIGDPRHEEESQKSEADLAAEREIAERKAWVQRELERLAAIGK